MSINAAVIAIPTNSTRCKVYDNVLGILMLYLPSQAGFYPMPFLMPTYIHAHNPYFVPHTSSTPVPQHVAWRETLGRE
jgi:hypothetical protein